MTNRYARRLVGIALVLAMAVLGGCSSPTKDSKSDEGRPVKGGSISIAVDSEPTGYDPATGVAPSPGAYSISAAIFTNLTALGEDGTYQPFFAESVESNDDAKVWTIKLRAGNYSDGTPIDAESVVFNLERVKETGLAYGQVDKFEATDPKTVTITMNTPWSGLPATLASQAGWLASPTAIKSAGKDFATKPVGSGAYVMAENLPGDHVTLEKNPDYWRGDVANLERVTFRPIADADSRLAALQAGDVDAASIDAGTGAEANLETSGFTTNEAAAATDLVYLNTGAAPLDDVRVRQALAYATDRDAMVKSVWKGSGEVADSPVLPGTPFAADVDFPGFDPEKARQLLQDYGKPVSLTLSFSNDPTQQVEAQALQGMWKDVGVDVQLGTPKEAGTHAEAVIGKKYEAAVFGFPPLIDPDKWFNLIWRSGAAFNVSDYKDPTIDAALDKAGQETDQGVRQEQYAIVQEQLAEKIYAIFLHYPVQMEAFRSGVHGADALKLPDGTKAPYGEEFRVPFSVESMWVDQG